MKKAEQLALNDFRERFDLEEAMGERDGGERDMGAVIDALQNLSDQVQGLAGPRPRGRRRDRDEDDDRGMSVRDMDERGGRRGEPHSISFEVKVPVGRQGGTLRGFITFDNVTIRDDRDVEDLANEVERKFRCANVFTKQADSPNWRGNGNGWHGGGWNGGRNDYYRGRDWDRDRRW